MTSMGKTNPAFELGAVERSGMREIHPLDGALLLMHFAFRGLIRDADRLLARYGLSRVHHRILYVVARSEGISIGGLLDVLGVSKQALHGPMKLLVDNGYVTAERDKIEHRKRVLRLSAKGIRLERAASDCERKAIGEALGNGSVADQLAWREVMIALAKRA